MSCGLTEWGNLTGYKSFRTRSSRLLWALVWIFNTFRAGDCFVICCWEQRHQTHVRGRGVRCFEDPEVKYRRMSAAQFNSLAVCSVGPAFGAGTRYVGNVELINTWCHYKQTFVWSIVDWSFRWELWARTVTTVSAANRGLSYATFFALRDSRGKSESIGIFNLRQKWCWQHWNR